jgi:hypothetical protein
MEQLAGVIAEFGGAEILHNDVANFGSVRADTIELTVRTGRLSHLEVLIGGYDDDPRALYMVPEVRRWIRLVKERWPDALFWLTPSALWLFALSLNPDMVTPLHDGRRRIALDTEKLSAQLVHSYAEAGEILAAAGMAEDAIARASQRAFANFSAMLERKQYGDYAVVHPEDGTIMTYRAEG